MSDATHLSLFSGAGGFDLGLERAGWRTVAVSDVDPAARAVLADRWPGVPDLGDITRIFDVPTARLWTGGFPCQDFSTAGLRLGFAGDRSVLAFEFLRLVEVFSPEAILLENVAGLLSGNGGRDFGALLDRMVELGYGVAWRTLDSRFFGVPHRRRRVFVLGLRCAGDDVDGRLAAERAAAVLAVGAGCPRHPVAGSKRLGPGRGG